MCLPSAAVDECLAVGDAVETAGWGQTEDGDVSDDLKEADMTLVPDCDDVCGDTAEGVLCAEASDDDDGVDGGRTCYGDSGSFLGVADPSTGAYTVHGITSYGGGGCPDDLPSGFTEVCAFAEWIRQQL